MTLDVSGVSAVERLESASQGLYIKLGAGGAWSRWCIDHNVITLGFRRIPHDVCLRAVKSGDWSEARASADEYSRQPADVVRQVRSFYEAEDDTVWFTFHRRRMWWCFSSGEVYDEGIDLAPGAGRYRRVEGRWFDSTIPEKKPLWTAEITGKLTKKQAYRGTLLTLKKDDLGRLVDRIHGVPSEAARRALRHQAELEHAVARAIESLNEHDFETLADLVLSRAGLRRSTPVGETQKTIDFEGNSLFSTAPIHVQVKAGLSPSITDEKTLIDDLAELPGRAIVVANVDKRTFGTDERVEIVDRLDLSRYCVDFGLTDWVVRKAG